MALIRVEVSDYDITKGVPLWNLNTKPYPRLVNGEPTWQIPDYNDPDNPALQHAVVAFDQLSAQTGVAPRRSGNNYAVTKVVAAPGGDVSLNHSPRLDYVPYQANSTLTYSKWVYVKKASGTNNTWGFGVSTYDQNFVTTGGKGDSAQGTIPSNQWVRIHYTETNGASPVTQWINTVLTLTISGLAVGDVVISTDYMSSYTGLIDYFDGSFTGTGNTVYEWTGVSESSRSTMTTSAPSSVRVFPPENIINYSVTEDAMSLDPSDFSGGYGTITFDIDSSPEMVLLRGKTFELEDGDKGKTTGVVTNLSSTDGQMSVTTDSMLGVLNSWGSMDGMEGTLSDFVTTLFFNVGLTLPVRYEGDVDQIPVVSRSYVGNFWDMMKQFLSAHEVEMSLVYNTVVFRPYRTYEAYMGRSSAEGWEVTSGETAHSVEITYYNNEYGFFEFYPEQYDDPDYNPTIMQVAAGETVEYTLQLSGTVNGISEPIHLNTVPNEPAPFSQYAVTGSDDLPVTTGQWADGGGSLSVKINETDPSKVDVTLVGANIPHLSPFRIAMSSGSGNHYNALHLTGTGVKFSPETVRIPTGAASDTTGTEIGVTVENPYISTRAQAYSLGARVAARFSGMIYSVNGTAWDINRRNYTGGVYANIADFNESRQSGDTIADFNADYSGMLVIDFNAMWDQRISDEFPVQAFGNAAGARVRTNDAYFRISQATFTPIDVNYTATLDTMVGDFNEVWGGATVADFNEEHFNKFVRDFSLIPLRRTDGS